MMYSTILPAKLVTTSKYDDLACFPRAQMKPAANQPNDTHNLRPFPSGSSCIWSECGIDVSELETTAILNTIRALRWGSFVFPRSQFHPQIVWEFYAAVVPDIFKESGTVIVRGCKVQITAKLINKYFHTPHISNNLILGLSRQDFFAKMDPGFASVLRWDESNKSRDLLYEELHPEMALWTVFINQNLIPSKNPLMKSVLSLEQVQLLFSIKRCLPIDVGRIIYKQIGDAKKSSSNLLPFPSLITHFCRISGVVIGEKLFAPMPDIGRDSYDAFARYKGLPTLVSKKRGREPLPVQPQNDNADRPKWVKEIMGRLNSLSEMMVGQFNALSTQINNLGVRVTSLEDALRDAGFKQLDPSRRVRPRPME